MPEISIPTRSISYPCQGILFDKDGTLLDFLTMWGVWADRLFQLVEAQLEQMGASFDQSVAHWLGLTYDSQGCVSGYDRCGPIAMGTAEEVTALLASRLYESGLAWNDAIATIRALNKEAMIEIEQLKPARALPGVVRFLQHCSDAGIRLAVVTSDTTSEAVKHLEWMGIRSYFSSIVGQDRVITGKPDPEMANLAFRELGLQAKDCIIIGDSNGDMKMGKNAGVAAAIGIAEDTVQEPSFLYDADYVVASYDELVVRHNIGDGGS